ncbi:MAG: hypothetical protein ACKO5J_11645, partial [Rubrivivax sp.]
MVLTLLASGCSGIGPRNIQGSRADYNVAIQQTNEQEVLLNLVRLKYRDTTYFLRIGISNAPQGPKTRPRPSTTGHLRQQDRGRGAHSERHAAPPALLWP